VTETVVLHGRRFQAQDLILARDLIEAHPDWSRYRLSRELCAVWDWRTATGQWRDMAARTGLLKLEQRGWLCLPERRMGSPNRHRLAAPVQRDWDRTPIAGSLADVGPVQIQEVSCRRSEREELRAALATFHYLGYRAPTGGNLQYVVRDRAGHLLAVAVFAGAAWKCAARDRWIGWSSGQREANLNRIANNVRFLLLPWVRVPQLGSWILGALGRRIARDWQAKYGHRVVLLETFVERDRFAGTCYRAANWLRVGQTTGRGRADRYRMLHVPVKELYAHPLRPDFREALSG
jgi:hypothetical protein